MRSVKIIGAALALTGLLLAQTPGTQDAVMQLETTPVFRVSSVSRTAKAVSYRHRSGATKVDFEGTALMPNAQGEAKVRSKKGYLEIEAKFNDLKPAAGTGGAEYLTYVLWAISPEGRTVNLGEVVLNGGKSKLSVTTDLQAFGLMVTAEPYFSVTRPSDLMVLQSVVRDDTVGKVEAIDAKFELLQVGQYKQLANPLELKLDRKIPLELYQARNAVQIARASGADRFASESYQKAEVSLRRAEAYQARKAGKKPVAMTAREAVQAAEDSRIIAMQRQEEASLANEREAAAARELRARDETERVSREAAAAELRARNEADRVRSQTDARLAADQDAAARLKRQNEAQRADNQVEAERLKRQNEAATAAARTEADRLKAQNDARYAADQETAARLKRENEARRADDRVEADRLQRQNEAEAAAARMEADRLKADNAEQRAAVQAGIEREAAGRAQSEADKAVLRAELLQQFNSILETRDSARGLIVNMSDVLFDSAQYALRPAAREKLAKVAGVVSGHAGLQLAVEGHTDSQGGDAYNQQLSEQRGSAVRDYLIEQGMAADSISSQGFGKGRPVASNETGAGRQENRRVEIVVSGEIIGGGIETPTAAAR